MEAAIHKLSPGAMVMALLMLLFGSFMFVVGYVGLSEWRSERAALIACNDPDGSCGIRICNRGSLGHQAESAGTPNRRNGACGIRCSLGDGRGDRCAAMHWPGLDGAKTDFRRKSNRGRAAGIEKGKKSSACRRPNLESFRRR